MAEWLYETQCCKVAASNPTRSRVITNWRLFFLIFLFSFDRAAFWSCSRKCLRNAVSPLCKSKANSTIEQPKCNGHQKSDRLQVS